MPQSCNICSHARRLEIDREIVQGKNLAKIAEEFDVPYHSIYAHSQKHISRQLVKVFEQRDVIESNNLLNIIDELLKRCNDIFERNYKKGHDVTALKAIDSSRNTIQLLANISAQVHAAKMAELQQLKDQSGNKGEEKEKFSKDIKIFTMEELEVFNRLINKMNNQDNDKVIRNGRVIPNKPIQK
jgi:transposase-like protein